MTYSDKDLFEYYQFVAFQISNSEMSKTEIDELIPFERYVIADALLTFKKSQIVTK